MLVLHGDDDRLVPLAVARELHRRGAPSELVVAEGGSHMLPITPPDPLAERVAGFASPR